VNTFKILFFLPVICWGCRHVTPSPESLITGEEVKYSYFPSGKLKVIEYVMNDSIMWTVSFYEEGSVNNLYCAAGKAHSDVYFNRRNEVDYILATSRKDSHSIFQYKNWGPQRELKFFSFIHDTLLSSVRTIPRNIEFFMNSNYAMDSPQIKWDDKGRVMSIDYFEKGFLTEEVNLRESVLRKYNNLMDITSADSIYIGSQD